MKKAIFLSLAIFSTQADAMFCPNSFNEINIGDTIDTVTKLCGKPDVQTTTTDTSNIPQEWSYYVNPDPGAQAATLVPQANTLKMTVAFQEEKVINITVNGQTLVTTPICGASIQVGDTPAAVKSACGAASYIKKGEPQQGEPAESKLTTFNYTSSTPPAVLLFKNGLLTERK